MKTIAEVIAERFPFKGGDFCYHCGANKTRDLRCVKGQKHENEAEVIAAYILKNTKLDGVKVYGRLFDLVNAAEHLRGEERLEYIRKEAKTLVGKVWRGIK